MLTGCEGPPQCGDTGMGRLDPSVNKRAVQAATSKNLITPKHQNRMNIKQEPASRQVDYKIIYSFTII